MRADGAIIDPVAGALAPRWWRRDVARPPLALTACFALAAADEGCAPAPLPFECAGGGARAGAPAVLVVRRGGCSFAQKAREDLEGT